MRAMPFFKERAPTRYNDRRRDFLEGILKNEVS